MNLKQIFVIILLIGSMIILSFDGEGTDIDEESIPIDDLPLDFTPILIDGNSDLVNQSSSNGWPGNGTESNPYVIENLDLPSIDGFALEIKNVDLHLILKNCTSSASSPMETGIYIDNTKNLTLQNVSIYSRGRLLNAFRSSFIEMINIRTGGDCYINWGFFNSCDNLSIKESDLADRTSGESCRDITFIDNIQNHSSIDLQQTTGIGIINSTNSGTSRLEECKDFMIRNCSVGDSTSFGFTFNNCDGGILVDNNLSGSRGQIELIDSGNIKMYNNRLGQEGLRISGEISDLYSLEIPVNNTINDDPIVMIKDNNLTSLVDNPNPSQIIMINITTLRISGNDFESDPKSMQIIQSDDVIFDNLTISNSSFGISMLSSKNIHIENCTMEDLFFGAITIENSDRISVENCVFSDIMDEYFKITGSRDFSFKSLIITEVNHGDVFEVRSSLNGTFRDIRINSGFTPFRIDHCESLRLEGCNISSNYGILIEESEDIILKSNRIETKNSGIIFEYDENVIIVDNSIISESRSGVYQEYCHNIVYFSNKLEKCSFIFECRPDDQLGILLPSNNTVDGKPVLYMNPVNSRSINNDDIWGQIVIDEVNGYKVEDLTIVNRNYPFQVFSSFGFKIHNCSFIDTYFGIKTQNSESMRITSTRFDNTTLCINAESAGNLFIDKCSFNNTDGGISIWSRWSDDIKNAKILDCSFLDSRNSIDVEDIQTVDVERCSFQQGTRAISFRYGMKGYIKNCELTNISGHGINLYRFSESIIDNNILINVSTGLITDKSNNQKVHDNLFAGCHNQAIKSEYGYNEPNWFSNNIFINNNGAGEVFNSSHIQAYCENEKDYWNNSLKRGNYWSDWTGPDLNNDGIVDDPYPISGEANMDNYPLVEHPFKLIGAPVNVTGEVGNGFLKLSWEEPEWNLLDGIKGYRIYRDSSGEDTKIFEIDGSTRSFNDTTIVNEKRYTYQVTALNEYGKSEGTEKVQMTGDGTPPYFRDVIPVNNSLFNESRVEIKWIALDDSTGYSNAFLSLDQGEWMPSDSHDTHLLENLTDGYHEVRIRILDRVGNQQMTGMGFTVDTTPPTLEIWSDLEENITNRTRISVNWSSEDVMSGLEYYMISINGGGWQFWGNRTDFSFNDIETGLYVLGVKACDRAGNENTTKLGFECDIDSPFIKINSPQSDVLIEDGDVEINWTLMEDGSGIQEILLSVDGDEFVEIENTGTFTILDMDQGIHTIVIKVMDMAGNWDMDRVHFMTGTISSQISRSPEGREVLLDSRIEVEFSKEIGSLNLEVRDLNGTFKINGNRAIFIPDQLLIPGSQYHVNYSGVDINGLPIEPFNWSFETVDLAKVTGTIIDENSDFLCNVEVIVNGNRVTNTGPPGEFIMALKEGHHSIMFHKEGFVNRTMELDISYGDEKDLGTIIMEIEELDSGNGSTKDRNPLILIVLVVVLILLSIIVIIAFMARRSRSENTERNQIDDNGGMKEASKDPATSFEELYGTPSPDYTSQSSGKEEDFFSGHDNPPME